MREKTAGGVHWSFWVIGAFALIWNSMGAINFFMQMNPETLAAMPESHRAIAESRPLWASIGFAVAVFGGALGALLLLLRKSAALYVLIASAAGVGVTMIHALILARMAMAFGPFEIIVAILAPIAVAAFLIWYARLARSKGWIG